MQEFTALPAVSEIIAFPAAKAGIAFHMSGKNGIPGITGEMVFESGLDAIALPRPRDSYL